MASNSSVCLTTIVAFMILCLAPPSAGVPSEELDRALSVLRFRGRALFANAIATSDLLFDLLSADSLTLLSPTDSTLFAVDMSRSLPFYLSTLSVHAIPLRLSLSDLRSLPNSSSLPTLLPSHHIFLTMPSSSLPDSICLSGVPLLLPGLFYSRHLAVHGLSGLLPFTASLPISPAPFDLQIPNKTHQHHPPIADSRSAAALSPLQELKRRILPLSPAAYTTPVVPAAGASGYDGYAPEQLPQASPDSFPEMDPRTGDSKPWGIGEVSLQQLAFQVPKDGGEEDKIRLDMETREF